MSMDKENGDTLFCSCLPPSEGSSISDNDWKLIMYSTLVEKEKRRKEETTKKKKKNKNWETCPHRHIVFPFIIYTMCLQVDLPWQNLILDPQPLRNTNTYWQNRSEPVRNTNTYWQNRIELSVCKSKSLPVPLCVLVLSLGNTWSRCLCGRKEAMLCQHMC